MNHLPHLGCAISSAELLPSETMNPHHALLACVRASLRIPLVGAASLPAVLVARSAPVQAASARLTPDLRPTEAAPVTPLTTRKFAAVPRSGVGSTQADPEAPRCGGEGETPPPTRQDLGAVGNLPPQRRPSQLQPRRHRGLRQLADRAPFSFSKSPSVALCFVLLALPPAPAAESPAPAPISSARPAGRHCRIVAPRAPTAARRNSTRGRLRRTSVSQLRLRTTGRSPRRSTELPRLSPSPQAVPRSHWRDVALAQLLAHLRQS
mmetsp:Transcript_22565/g.57101  ORF Transcript_22565/g.57101 Transcript_22565/m.57101 type:complete len:265 (-) Transcript_22565:1142-1936(-)